MTSPLVSIIIPVVNNLRFNRQCVESIREHTEGDYEIVVVDNNSTDGSREYFQNLGDQIRLIRNDGLRTFAQSCNQGAENARGEYLTFLNNDAYVTPGWLAAMLDCIRSDPKIGMVGNKQLFPANRLLSHAGGVFNEFRPEHIYMFFNPELPFLNRDREYQWVTAACAMISRKLFFEAGGFCEEYKNSFEDVDLCFRLRERGYKIYYCHKSTIYHYGQGTAGRRDNEDQNTRLFYRKWGDKIIRDKEDYLKLDDVPDVLKPALHPLETYLHFADRHLELLKKAVDGLNKHVDGLNKDVDGLNKHVDGLNKHVDGLNKHVDGLNKHVDGLNKHVAAQQEHIEGLEKRCAGLEKIADDQKRHIEAVHNTLSWRVTRPLRAIKRFFSANRG